MNQIQHVLPTDLNGPRSYFTDLDPRDSEYQRKIVERKLKLQLLTKKNVVMAASSMFHDIGYELFKEHKGLEHALDQGIILPAIRDQFSTVDDFFGSKAAYSDNAKDYFGEKVRKSVYWSLKANSGWFQNKIYSALSDDQSVLRQSTKLSAFDAARIINVCDEVLSKLPEKDRFLSREIVKAASLSCQPHVAKYIENYTNLIYRISGAKVVSAEGHFPQSNLVKIGIVHNDHLVSDDSIFWDIFIEAAANHLSKASEITVDRIDRLEFTDILNLRKGFFETDFVNKYDELIVMAKSDIDISDPDELILKAEEIAEASENLNKYFRESIFDESLIVPAKNHENALWEVLNVIAAVSAASTFDPKIITGTVGVLSILKAMPTITTIVSNDLARTLSERSKYLHHFVNNRIGWSKTQKASLLDAYKLLTRYS